jgi:hypothetical protein
MPNDNSEDYSKPEGFNEPQRREQVTQHEADGTHPGFTVICRTCDSTLVSVNNTLGFSATSGGWGEVELVCSNCGAYTEIVSS